MTIKKRRLIAHFLEHLKVRIEKQKSETLSPELLTLLSKEELLEIIQWMFQDTTLGDYDLDTMSSCELFNLIGDDVYVLSFLIEKWNQNTIKKPSCSDKEVNELFSQFGIGAHYLRHKPSKNWDEYDKSNYYAILRKHGRVRTIYGIFSSDVLEADKHEVTTKPNVLFDTKEEAEQEIERRYKQGIQEQNTLKVLSLWQLINF